MKTKNIQLTKNFYLKEYFVDKKNPEMAACLFDECTPFMAVLAFELALDQQTMRDYINDQLAGAGKIKLINTSGSRDSGLNAAQVGSALDSLHTLMRAVDFKTVDPDHLKKIYAFITLFSELDYRECFIYVTEDGTPTNIHYAKKAPGYIDTRKGIYVRPRKGGKPIRIDRYFKSISGFSIKRFKEKLSMAI